MALLLPLSPTLSAPLATAHDLQSALFQLSTFTSVDQAQAAMGSIADTIAPHRQTLENLVSSKGVTYRRELRYFDFLRNGNAEGARLALSEIAMHPKALDILRTQSGPLTLPRLAEKAMQIKVDATAVQQGHLRWAQTPMSGNTDDSPLTLWGKVTYALSSLTAPKNWLAWTSAASMAPELAYWAGTGQIPCTLMAASAAALTGALYGMAHRNSAKERLVSAAQQRPLDFQAVQQFFTSFNRAFPNTEPLRFDNDNGGVIEAIRRSSAPGGMPHSSLSATGTLIADFLNLGSATVQGLKSDCSKEVYGRLAQAIGLGTLAGTHWQPTILNAERLEEIAEYRRQGKKIIFVANHRSHLDILIAVTLLRDFDIRFVAKDSLLKVPVLGDILRLAGHFTVDREHDDARLDKVMAWGSSIFEQGLSPLFFIEGTRMDTPKRKQEIGIRPPEIGAAKLAAKYPNDVVVVGIVSTGFGSLLRKEGEAGSVSQGTTLHQPTITSILKPIEVSSIMDQDPSLSTQEEIRFNSYVWGKMWDELSRIQAYANDLAIKAA